MSEIKAEPGEMRATIHITRAATGKTETLEIIGHADPEKLAAIMKARRTHDAVGGLIGESGVLTNQPLKESEDVGNS